jgi:hypothetical protein
VTARSGLTSGISSGGVAIEVGRLRAALSRSTCQMDDQPHVDRKSDASFDIDAGRLKLARHFDKEFPAQPSDRPAAADAAQIGPRGGPEADAISNSLTKVI